MTSPRTPRIANGLPDGRSVLDEVNRRILILLREDPRQSTAQLARKVGMSAPAVRERVAGWRRPA